ncbi:NERD domain-containing protein [Bacillus sp. F19]|nr:NERD domain-containing protein [Bacillus sp. F19]
MAQLIKIHSCISRYEMDLYRYQSQFLRLKKQQWQMIKLAYENNEFQQFVRPHTETMDGEEGKEEKKFLRKVRNILRKKEEIVSCDLNIPAAEKQADTMEFIFHSVPQSLDELKAKFMNHIFQFQMKWATSTIREKSYADASFYENERLLELLQKLPDQHLIMYNPVFKIKNTSIGLDPILISPGEIVCIHYLEGGQHDVIEGTSERFWTVNPGDHEKKQLSPLISLNRTGTIVKQLLRESKIDLEVKKVLLYKSGFIEFPQAPYDLTLVDKRNFSGWFQFYRNSTTPIKHEQLKAAEILLSQCLIDSFCRND